MLCCEGKPSWAQRRRDFGGFDFSRWQTTTKFSTYFWCFAIDVVAACYRENYPSGRRQRRQIKINSYPPLESAATTRFIRYVENRAITAVQVTSPPSTRPPCLVQTNLVQQIFYWTSSSSKRCGTTMAMLLVSQQPCCRCNLTLRPGKSDEGDRREAGSVQKPALLQLEGTKRTDVFTWDYITKLILRLQS